MRPLQILFLLVLSLLLGACSPHPGTGIWSVEQDNEFGISRLTVNYDGKAEFNATKPENISWRCFWGAAAKQEISMTCTPSNDPEQEYNYALTVEPWVMPN